MKYTDNALFIGGPADGKYIAINKNRDSYYLAIAEPIETVDYSNPGDACTDTMKAVMYEPKCVKQCNKVIRLFVLQNMSDDELKSNLRSKGFYISKT